MVDDNELNRLGRMSAPAPSAEAKARALASAMQAFDEKNMSVAPQGSATKLRLTERAHRLWSEMMNRKLLAMPALAGLVALPIAGYATFYLMEESPFNFGVDHRVSDGPAIRERDAAGTAEPLPKGAAEDEIAYQDKSAATQSPRQELRRDGQSRDALSQLSAAPQPAAEAFDTGGMPQAPAPVEAGRSNLAPGVAPSAQMMTDQSIGIVLPEPMPHIEANRDRIEDFKTNPVRSALEDPVSTFSIDVDTASYSFVRRSLKQGMLPQADTVRVEEMINYFPYDWKGPDAASTPFNSTVSVMPTPWNGNTKLMHVAIKGFDVKPAEKPHSNLVFLLDVSGSMDGPDRLPLAQASFRLLVDKLQPDDTVSIVTYAGNSGIVLEPTRVSERAKILDAINNLQPGGSTAGEAGIKEAYRLAEKAFVKGGVNRIMLATDGDFNVGATDDEDLKRLVEEKRKSGVMLSVFGYGQGNNNDQLMQVLAQNGNGTAAYIDTLAEAEKVLVQDASSTLFTIAKDVKIQIEFNPAAVSEYRLIGYETRALATEDFNNDRIDAGEIGSGHSVTAIYEITPKGSPAQSVDELRYGEATTNSAAGIANADEYAFVKIRYKLPDEDISKLITKPVTKANEVSSFDAAGTDQRFSVAVAAFGQKLRDADQVANFGYDRIMEIATAARGTDPFGYRAEFLSLVRLASALDGGNR